MALFAELKRRRIFRMAGLYAVVSWITTEVSATVLPALNVPDWTVTLVVVLLVLGFPVAMLFAWAYDIDVDRTGPAHGMTRRGVLAYAVMLVVATLSLVAVIYPGGPRGLVSDARMSLARLGGASLPDRPRSSIAVLPFANISPDVSDEYFSDGISEELINLLTAVPDLKVAARTSAFAYKGQNADVRTIARMLDVETVLEGSVRRSGDRLRITAQLIDAETGFHLWSQTYDRKLEDIFVVQDEISRSIVAALKPALQGTQSQTAMRETVPTDNVEAYQLYLQGRHQLNRRGESAVRKSIERFQAAIRLDPRFAHAQAALAAAYTVLTLYSDEPMDRVAELAELAAVQALALNENLAEAHAVLAHLDLMKMNWLDAESGFFFAISLDPQYPTAHHWYSVLLRDTGRLEHSLREARLAYELDPASPVINVNLAKAYAALDDTEAALRHLDSATDLGFEGELAPLRIALYLRTGQEAEALAALRMLLADAFPGNPEPSLKDMVALITREPDSLPGSLRLALLAYGAQSDAIMRNAAALLDAGSLPVASLWHPEMQPVRSHASFPTLMRATGLPGYWERYGAPDGCVFHNDALNCG